MNDSIKKIKKRLERQKSEIAKLEKEIFKLNQKKETKIHESIAADKDLDLKAENAKLLQLEQGLKDAKNVFLQLVEMQNRAAEQLKHGLIDEQEKKVAEARAAYDRRNDEIKELQNQIKELNKTVEFREGTLATTLQRENSKLAVLKQKPALTLAGVVELPKGKSESIPGGFDNTTEAENFAWEHKVNGARNRTWQSLDTNQGYKFLAKLDDRHFNEITKRMAEKERETAMNYREVHKKGLHSDSWIDLRTGKLRVSLDKVGIESGELTNV